MEAQLNKIREAQVSRRGLLRRVGAGSLAIAAAPLIGKALSVVAAPSDELDRMVGRFEMQILEGPSKGAAIKGNLYVAVSKQPETRGEMRETVLVTDDFKVYTVGGNVTGQAMNVVFTGLDGKIITGTGAISTTKNMAGGASVGPAPADSGTWYFDIKGRDSR